MYKKEKENASVEHIRYTRLVESFECNVYITLLVRALETEKTELQLAMRRETWYKKNISAEIKGTTTHSFNNTLKVERNSRNASKLMHN